MKLKKIVASIAMLTVVGVFATACSNNRNSKTTSTIARTTSTDKNGQYISDSASFTVNKNGAVKNSVSARNHPHIDIYFDPLCPACGEFDQTNAKVISNAVANKGVYVTYHPLMFLDSASKDKYSTRAAAFTFGVAENAPKLAANFVTALYSKDFLPDESSPRRVPNSELVSLFKKIGGTDAQARAILKDMAKNEKLALSATESTIKNKPLAKKSPTGSLFTPFVLTAKANHDATKALQISSSSTSQMKSEIAKITK